MGDNIGSEFEDQQKVGFWGYQTDPTPNHAYTVDGVNAEEPTPETDDTAHAAAVARTNAKQRDIPTSSDVAAGIGPGTPSHDLYSEDVPAVTTGAADKLVEFSDEIEDDGTVVSVTFTPGAAATGTDTNSRTLRLVNKGNSNAIVAELALVSGVNLVKDTPKAITLSGTGANKVVHAGDDLEFRLVKVGTGLATPAGRLLVRVDKS